MTNLTDEPCPGHWHLLDGREGRLGDDLQGGAHRGAEGAQEEARHLGQPGTHFPWILFVVNVTIARYLSK